MNELIGSFAGKRLAIFGALIAAIALLAAGGALSIKTADAQNAGVSWAGDGLDHIQGGVGLQSLKISLAVGTRHHVCLMEDVSDQQFREDSDNAASGDGDPNADPPTENSDGSGDTPGDPNDIDDLDWDVRLDNVGEPLERADGSNIELGPAGVRSTAPRAAGSLTGETAITGWHWVIETKAGTGSPTISNPVRTFPNRGHAGNEGAQNTDEAEACVHWTSTAPGTQIVKLYMRTQLAATGANIIDIRRADSNLNVGGQGAETEPDISAATSQLEVTWVDSDPLITVTRAVGGFAPTRVTAPIAQRMDFVGGSNADASYTSEGGTEIAVSVAAVQSALVSRALTGANVSFAVTGTCGIVDVPGAVVSPTQTGNIRPGQTGTIADWGTDAVTATFKNAGTGAEDSYPKCRRSSSSTTLTITSGSATNAVTVNWGWDGYAVFTLENVDDTTKRVTFQSATPKNYNALGQSVGWECNSAGQAREFTYNVDGRATVTAGASTSRLGTVTGTTAITPTSQGAATPLRTLGAMDSECQAAWTIKSPARAADVYVDISSLGVDAYSEVLNFAPEAPAVTTLDDLEDPLAPGTDFVIWTGEDTAVADAIGDSGATAVYYWVSATQSWLSFFPGSAGLGVNNLTTLQQGEIYVVSTPSN